MHARAARSFYAALDRAYVEADPLLDSSLNDQSRDRGLRRGASLGNFIARFHLGRFLVAPLSGYLWGGAGLAVLASLLLLSWGFEGSTPSFVTQSVTRGPLTVVVNAAGSLAPRDQVDIGAEISGRIDSIAVDFDDRVRKGQVLARINTDQLQAQLAQARATLDQSQATFEQNEDTIRRDRALAKTGAVSPQQLVAAEGDYSRARAGVALAAAQVKQDETMLSKATIYSPIDGVVLDRKVSAGQTLVATMQTPVLFTLASDLSQMELRVAIDETEVGQLHKGSLAGFIVDAYPGRQFAATLISIHNAPQTVKGVVTYEGVLLVQNREGLLKPGMTARVSLEASHLHDALLLPNSALRYVPPESVKEVGPSLSESRNGVPWGRVWSLDGRTLVQHEVRLGPSDGKRTAILGGDLKPGDQVVVGTKQN